MPDYADENLSLFAVPAYSKVDAPVPCSSHPGSPKRKNASDHASPSSLNKRKRNSEEFEESRALIIGNLVIPSGTARWDYLAAHPSEFSGLGADLWRRLVVQHMFPGKLVTAPSKGDTSLPTSRTIWAQRLSDHDK